MWTEKVRFPMVGQTIPWKGSYEIDLPVPDAIWIRVDRLLETPYMSLGTLFGLIRGAIRGDAPRVIHL